MAGELGATMIVQKEITVPPSPLNLDLLGHGQVDGAPRIPRLASPSIIENSDVSPLSLTDAEASDEELVSGRVLQQPSGPDTTIALSPSQPQSSPLPIIRDFPYGYNAWSFSRTPSSQLSASPPLSTSTSLPTFNEADSDVDDDAAFAFDLDISNFSRTAHPASASKIVVLATDDDAAAANLMDHQRHHRQIKHKKPQLTPSPVDPVDKALQRRARRESRREQRRPNLLTHDTLVNTPESRGGPDEVVLTGGAKEARERDEHSTNVNAVATPRSISSQLTLSDDLSEENGAGLSPSVKAAEDASCVRLIAEALIVRKFPVEVEETYFKLDNLQL
jgi:hypothetical protein